MIVNQCYFPLLVKFFKIETLLDKLQTALEKNSPILEKDKLLTRQQHVLLSKLHDTKQEYRTSPQKQNHIRDIFSLLDKAKYYGCFDKCLEASSEIIKEYKDALISNLPKLESQTNPDFLNTFSDAPSWFYEEDLSSSHQTQGSSIDVGEVLKGNPACFIAASKQKTLKPIVLALADNKPLHNFCLMHSIPHIINGFSIIPSTHKDHIKGLIPETLFCFELLKSGFPLSGTQLDDCFLVPN